MPHFGVDTSLQVAAEVAIEPGLRSGAQWRSRHAVIVRRKPMSAEDPTSDLSDFR